MALILPLCIQYVQSDLSYLVYFENNCEKSPHCMKCHASNRPHEWKWPVGLGGLMIVRTKTNILPKKTHCADAKPVVGVKNSRWCLTERSNTDMLSGFLVSIAAVFTGSALSELRARWKISLFAGVKHITWSTSTRSIFFQSTWSVCVSLSLSRFLHLYLSVSTFQPLSLSFSIYLYNMAYPGL